MKMIQAHVDHAAVGSGQRRFFVLAEGKKWTTLLDPTQLVRFRVKPTALRRSEEVKIDRRWHKRNLRKKAKDFRRWERRFPRKVVKQLIEELSQ